MGYPFQKLLTQCSFFTEIPPPTMIYNLKPISEERLKELQV
jgi:hypothetical protein